MIDWILYRSPVPADNARNLCRIWTGAALLTIEMQQVVVLRMLRLAVGGALAEREARRMVWEKPSAIVEIGLRTLISTMAGSTGPLLARNIIREYRQRVRSNRRRLRRH